MDFDKESQDIYTPLMEIEAHLLAKPELFSKELVKRMDSMWNDYLNSFSISSALTETQEKIWKSMKAKETQTVRSRINPVHFFKVPNDNMIVCTEVPNQITVGFTLHDFSLDDNVEDPMLMSIGLPRDAAYRYMDDVLGERQLLGNGLATTRNALMADKYRKITQPLCEQTTTYIPKQSLLALRMDQDLSFALNEHFNDVIEEHIP